MTVKLKIDGKRFDTSADAIRYLVREHSKQDLVELMLWSLTNPPEGYVLVNADMLAAALDAHFDEMGDRYHCEGTCTKRLYAALKEQA